MDVRRLRNLLVLACLGGLGLGFAWTTEGYEFLAPVFAAEVAVAGFAALRWIGPVLTCVTNLRNL
jgi:hypothetical protein